MSSQKTPPAGTILLVVKDQKGRLVRYIVECHKADGSLAWVADFVADERCARDLSGAGTAALINLNRLAPHISLPAGAISLTGIGDPGRRRAHVRLPSGIKGMP